MHSTFQRDTEHTSNYCTKFEHLLLIFPQYHCSMSCISLVSTLKYDCIQPNTLTHPFPTMFLSRQTEHSKKTTVTAVTSYMKTWRGTGWHFFVFMDVFCVMEVPPHGRVVIDVFCLLEVMDGGVVLIFFKGPFWGPDYTDLEVNPLVTTSRRQHETCFQTLGLLLFSWNFGISLIVLAPVRLEFNWFTHSEAS